MRSLERLQRTCWSWSVKFRAEFTRACMLHSIFVHSLTVDRWETFAFINGIILGKFALQRRHKSRDIRWQTKQTTFSWKINCAVYAPNLSTAYLRRLHGLCAAGDDASDQWRYPSVEPSQTAEMYLLCYCINGGQPGQRQTWISWFYL